MQSGNVLAIYIAAQADDAVLEKTAVTALPNQGVVGDRYYQPQRTLMTDEATPRKEDLTLISAEELKAFSEQFDLEIPYGDFRRNIITSGIDLNTLVGKKFRVGSAHCLGMELCEPCSKLARTVNRLVLPHLVGKAGIRAAILEPGEISGDDRIIELGA